MSRFSGGHNKQIWQSTDSLKVNVNLTLFLSRLKKLFLGTFQDMINQPLNTSVIFKPLHLTQLLKQLSNNLTGNVYSNELILYIACVYHMTQKYCQAKIIYFSFT